jgi:hypothetical protein
MVTGIVVGLLIGVVSGTVFLLLLKSARRSASTAQDVVTLTGELLAIPAFMVGGPWVSTGVLKLVELKDFINPYLISLAICFFLFCGYPAIRWISNLADELGRPERTQ